jgi:hypothetical protein
MTTQALRSTMAPAFRFLTAQIAAFILTMLLARVDLVAGVVAG